MKILSELTYKEIQEFILSLGESKFRANQIKNWLYFKYASTIDDMTDLSLKFRELLKTKAIITTTKIKQKQLSKDGTVKYLLEFEDGNCVETVLMRFDNRANLTACISSQVGCSMGCKFCATAKRGFIRNLSVYEIIDQILTIQRDLNLKVTNVVFMGQGEPLLNYDNVLKAIDFINDELQISKRRITLSTCGIIPKINKLAEIDFQPTLAVSLHATSHLSRASIMPIENKYDIDSLIQTLKDYTDSVSRRVTIEYTLIKDINSSIQDAKNLCHLLKDLKCNINLIVYNPCKDDKFEKPTKDQIQKFKYILEHSNKKVTIRLERGADIDAACGQLSGKVCS